MKLLREIADAKIPLKLRRAIKSECPLGNASMIPYKKGKYYLCSFREFNYIALYGKKRIIYKKRFKTRTKYRVGFALIDNKFNVVGHEFHETLYRMKENEIPRKKNLRFIDPRLFFWNNKLYIGMSLYMPNHKTLLPYMNVSEVNDKDWQITLTSIFNSYENNTLKDIPVKNWMQVPDKPFTLVHKINPTTTEIIDIRENKIYSTNHLENIVVPQDLRGNTALLEIDDKYITIAHTKDVYKYDSYFIVLNKNLEVEHISKSFRFDNTFQIEMSISMFFKNKSKKQTIGITVCEDDYFQYVYLIDRQKLMDFIYSTD